MPPTTQSMVHLTHIPTAGFRMTGRPHLLYKASYASAEKFSIIPLGNSKIAYANVAHVLADVVNQYNWRHKLVQTKE
jgi:hypothetical protein